MACKDCGSLSDMCGEKVYAPCVNVEMEFPDFSSLEGKECSTLDKILDDIYSLIGENIINIEDYDSDCLEFEEDITVISILNKLTEEVCTLKTIETEKLDILNTEISGIDLSCLNGVDPCFDINAPIKLKDLLQILVDKICELQSV